MFDYVVKNNIVIKKPVATLIVETDDPNTKIIPLAVRHEGDWIGATAEISKKDQRNIQSSEQTITEAVEE